jgi:hypothetical protein
VRRGRARGGVGDGHTGHGEEGRRRSGGLQGELDGDGGACAFYAFCRDGTAVLLDDAACTCQSYACALDAPTYICGANEAIEDVGKIGGGDANAVIGHGDDRAWTGGGFMGSYSYGYVPISLAVFDRVGE